MLLLTGTALAAAACRGAPAAGPAAPTEPEARGDSPERPEPAGALAAFRAESGAPPRYSVVLLGSAGEAVTLVGDEGDVQPRLFDRPAWAPDGARLAVTLDLAGSAGRIEAPTDLFVVEADGSARRRLTHTGDAFAPAWSPDGQTIVFSRREQARLPTAGLWAVPAGGGEPRRLLPSGRGRLDVASSFAPDGSVVAFTRTVLHPLTGAARSAIHVVAPDGSGLRRLTNRGADPAWSPDGEWIAFSSDRDENGELSYGDRTFHAGELYVMEADGGSPTRLTWTEALNERSPTWSPDGLWLAFQRGEQFDNAEAVSIHVLGLGDDEARVVATDAGRDVWYAAPSWRPRRAETP